MIKSPYQHPIIEKLKADAAIIKLAQELVTVHEKFIAKLDEINFTINKKVGPKGDRGIQGPKGEKGEKGEDGYSPSIQDITNQVLSKIELPKNGKDGKDGFVPIKGIDYLTENDIAFLKQEVLKSLPVQKQNDEDFLHLFTKKGKKLSIKHIDGLEQTISAFSNQLGRGYLHGGGDTVKAGTNITLTSNSDGTKTITAGGGTVETPTGTIDNSNVTFTVTTIPKWIVVNGAQYFEGAGYSRVGLTLTLESVVGTGGFIRAIS